MKIEDFFTRDEHNDGSEIRLKDKGGKLSPCFLTVVGPDSDKWREITADMHRDALMRSFDDADNRSSAELRAEYLAKAVISSRGFEGELDEERYKKLFIMAPYVSDQVDRFIADRSNFIKPPAKK